jgi:thiosulfate/3-mercaptopyruvate sulfurtransferase
MNNEIVSVEWLAAHLNDENMVILDASPESNVSGLPSTHAELSIPKARIFDLKEKFSDKESSFPNTVPQPDQFEQECRELGISNTSRIIVFDNLGIYTSPRVWWLFKVMGHENISVLDGGLPEWIKNGFETVRRPERNQKFGMGDFKSQYHPEYVILYDQVLENIQSNDFLIVDARSEGRFEGREEEPRKNLKSGHIPHSVNVPYQDLLEDGKFKTAAELRKVFIEKIDHSQKLVFSCGSGLTACIVMLASALAFEESFYLYDGSWTEYADLQNLKVDLD